MHTICRADPASTIINKSVLSRHRGQRVIGACMLQRAAPLTLKNPHLFCFLYFLFHMEVGTVISNMHSLESAQDSLNKHGNGIGMFLFAIMAGVCRYFTYPFYKKHL